MGLDSALVMWDGVKKAWANPPSMVKIAHCDPFLVIGYRHKEVSSSNSMDSIQGGIFGVCFLFEVVGHAER